MSLFSSIQLASNALNAAQIGLQVAGNNIANADTPGYIRQQVVLSPAPTQQYGGLLLGLGVQVEGVIQKVDQFLENRFRSATSDLSSGEAQENAYLELEALIGELTDTDLSSSLTRFFSSIHDVLNDPGSNSVRNLAALQGETLANDMNRLSGRVRELHQDADARIENTAGRINQLTRDIAELNVKIVTVEGSDTSASDAVGLRDQRNLAMEELAKIIDIRTFEQPTGSVTVFAGGDYLVADGTYRETEAKTASVGGVAETTVVLEETNAPLDIASGELAGLVQARDEILSGFLDQLDELARTLIFEFNKLHAGGQGFSGHQSLESEFSVTDADAALDAAGLSFTPVNGSFQVLVFDRQTGLPKTTDVLIKLGGLDDDTSLASLAAELDAIDGLAAEVTVHGQLVLSTESANSEFAFADDTSGVLAALGLNTFFTGTSASNIGVNQVVRSDPGKFAASDSGIGSGTGNAERMAAFLDLPLESRDGDSLATLYDQLTGEVTQGAAVTRSVAEGFRVFHQTLLGQHFAVSGVSLDEEAVNMMAFQRMYQATARYIATLDELMDTLVNL